MSAEKERPQTGKELVASLREQGLLGSYGDPNIDAVELARQIRREAEIRAGSKQTVKTWGARILRELKEEDALGVFQDRSEDSVELARKFREKAERRGGQEKQDNEP